MSPKINDDLKRYELPAGNLTFRWTWTWDIRIRCPTWVLTRFRVSPHPNIACSLYTYKATFPVTQPPQYIRSAYYPSISQQANAFCLYVGSCAVAPGSSSLWKFIYWRLPQWSFRFLSSRTWERDDHVAEFVVMWRLAKYFSPLSDKIWILWAVLKSSVWQSMNAIICFFKGNCCWHKIF